MILISFILDVYYDYQYLVLDKESQIKKHFFMSNGPFIRIGVFILMVGSYYLTYKVSTDPDDKEKQEDEDISEDLESLEVGIKENHKKLGSWSIVFYRVFLISMMFHQVSHEILDKKGK